MEGGFFVHPIQQHDCEQLCRIDSIENVEKNVNCTPEDEGVRLLYIRHVSLYIPTEVLIMCKPFEKLSEKISAFRKFIKKFSNFHVQKNLNDSATYCGERSGVKVEPLYTTRVCEFEQLVHYKRGEIVESITSDFHDIIQLTNFYENLDKNLPEDFHINETENPNRVSNLGCDKRNISDSEDGRCKLETTIKNSTDGTVEMIDRIHCCCDESSNNFLFLDNKDHTFLIQDLLKNNREGSCINMGGCEQVEGTNTPCDNIDRAVLLCFCSREEKYCDLKLYTHVHSDIKREEVEYFEPYCNTGEFAQENGGNIKVPDNPTGSLNQFFCYEMTTITSKEVNLVTTGFFNRITHKHYIESESKCLSFPGETSKQQCIQDGNTFFCCCKAFLRSSREHVDSRGACNKGDDVLKAYKRSLLFNTTILSNTMKERTHCDGIIENTHQRTQVSAWDMAFMPQLKCYFSIPLRPFKVDGAQINSYYYDPYNPKDDNMGIFSMLCNHKKWTKAELIGGYACRLMSTPMFKGGQDELACCSVAHLSEKNKETVNNQINKFILPNNFTRKDDRR
ncbi:hypothetical protein Ddc_17296 [Ditylenchus destructor]|nr:hypothetical protein Ddc_17296 [Ditylenchus destructor]